MRLTADRVSSEDFLELLREQAHALSSFKILKFLFVNALMTNNSFYHFYSFFADDIQHDEMLSNTRFFVAKLKENNVVLSRELESRLGLERAHLQRLSAQRVEEPISPENTFVVSKLEAKDYFFHVYNKDTHRWASLTESRDLDPAAHPRTVALRVESGPAEPRLPVAAVSVLDILLAAQWPVFGTLP